jgi:hypothetical protein
MTTQSDDDLVPLTDVIRALRSQLRDALAEGKNESLKFELGVVEVELSAVIIREDSKGGGLSFKLFSVGIDGNVSGKASSQRTMRIKLSLTPIAKGEGRTGNERGLVEISSTKKAKR